MADKLSIRIRFNTNFKGGDTQVKEWRVIVNGVEYFCNHVTVNCPSKTSKDFIEGIGNKWHISCEANSIEFIKDQSISDENSKMFKEIILH